MKKHVDTRLRLLETSLKGAFPSQRRQIKIEKSGVLVVSKKSLAGAVKNDNMFIDFVDGKVVVLVSDGDVGYQDLIDDSTDYFTELMTQITKFFGN